MCSQRCQQCSSLRAAARFSTWPQNMHGFRVMWDGTPPLNNLKLVQTLSIAWTGQTVSYCEAGNLQRRPWTERSSRRRNTCSAPLLLNCAQFRARAPRHPHQTARELLYSITGMWTCAWDRTRSLFVPASKRMQGRSQVVFFPREVPMDREQEAWPANSTTTAHSSN